MVGPPGVIVYAKERRKGEIYETHPVRCNVCRIGRPAGRYKAGAQALLKPLTTPAAIAVIKAKKAWSRADRP